MHCLNACVKGWMAKLKTNTDNLLFYEAPLVSVSANVIVIVIKELLLSRDVTQHWFPTKVQLLVSTAGRTVASVWWRSREREKAEVSVLYKSRGSAVPGSCYISEAAMYGISFHLPVISVVALHGTVQQRSQALFWPITCHWPADYMTVMNHCESVQDTPLKRQRTGKKDNMKENKAGLGKGLKEQALCHPRLGLGTAVQASEIIAWREVSVFLLVAAFGNTLSRVSAAIYILHIEHKYTL